jgi:low affinity Fe/Cu permease
MNDFFRKVTFWIGSSCGIFIGIGILVAWLLGGLFIGFTDFYQLAGNTFMSSVSYVLLFVIQNSVNRDSMTTQVKLNELIRSKSQANNASLFWLTHTIFIR